MKLVCSAGHWFDTDDVATTWWKGIRKDGDRCGEVLSYDRMSGTTRCRRVLRPAAIYTSTQIRK